MEKNMPMLMKYVLVPTVLAVIVFNQLTQLGRIVVVPFVINFIVAFISASIVLYLLPLDKIAGFWINTVKVKPGGIGMALGMNFVINIAFSVVLGLIMTFLNIVILAGQPISIVPFAFLGGLIPTFIVTFIAAGIGFKFYETAMMKKQGR